MKFLRDISVAQKKVLVRVDFNVSLDEKAGVLDDFKIRATLPTINWLLANGAGVVLMSHLKGLDSDEKFSLKPVAKKLAELIGREVKFSPDCVGPEAKRAAAELPAGEILLLENLRFHKEEKGNDYEFAKQLAALGDVYVDDAFAESHRDCASTTTITKFLPSCAGLLLEEEIKNLTRVRDRAEQPLCVIIGGAKISTKIKLIKSFLDKASNIILGGAIANTMLHAKGIAVGKSLIEEAMVPEIESLDITSNRLHLPVDALVCTDKNNSATCHMGPIGLIQEGEAIMDIGPDTEKLFSEVVGSAKTVIWNGPMGLFEVDFFAHGTRAIAKAVAGSGAFSVAGGGETVTFLKKNSDIGRFGFLSTGGGAMLEFLSGGRMPGIEALENADHES